MMNERRCTVHNVVISSPCGRFDGLCAQCEAEHDRAMMESEFSEYELMNPPSLTPAEMQTAARIASDVARIIADDDIPF